ncbi:putative chromatin assembly factor 1 subunit A [Rosa chinensis]|uniref:Putative chromatin assembly factor 1 subunit A n=1 Tax=Rosa chinensis TaxID=74649 RepID=A0A2P6R4Z5_ROSCH|nr:chromatin assembly factor 1 subunit FAS1 [Rosa chinensis]PRQ41488.1 putative chromatin assembly factor 1 subunit A [Rosa chinensis]
MTCEVVVIDGPSGQKTEGQDLVKKTKKRKRGSKGPEDLGVEEKEAKIGLFRKELDGLFGYYREVMSERGCLDLKQCGNDLKSVIGALMEESALPLSKLVDEVFQKLKNGNDAFGDVTLATVKKIVLLVGQREMYGVPNADADVLEDESESCLWCWETRDVKLMPASVRGVLNIRRTCRRKINERITAVSAMIMALQKPESDQSYIQELMKASEMIDKASCEAKIRSLMNRLSLKNSADMVKKQAKREEKLQIKQMERDKREAEKEKQRLERERQKEELQNEKEQKRLLEESEKVEKRREKEESEIRKLRRKQQEDAEKEQRRREKEEAKLKDQLSIKKQASIMDRFLKRTKPSPACQNDQLPTKRTVSISSSKNDENLSEAVTQSMDHTLSSNDKFSAQDIRRSHLSSWRHLGHSIRSNRNQSWGIRRKPKSELFKELKLTTSKELVHGDDSMEKLVDRWGEPVNDERSCQILAEVKKFKSRKQLLQFDKSHRPAFYGIWSKKSHVVRPCHPLRKDPDLDYDIDSDEDWEEEDPGESLSDCDKDDEGESLEEGCSKADDEDESEDGFFVPDGYLSENEGVEVDRMETDITCEETKSPSCKQDSESEKFSSLLRQQKYLGNLTERALQKNQPLIISNLMHEKASLLMAQDLSSTPKLEQMCLQALSIHVFPGDSLVEITVDGMQEEDPEVYLLNGKCSIKSSSAVAVIPELDLPAIVSVIQSCSQSINKVLQALQQKFPAASKTQLRNKVREISDFVDNHWQVKREILDKVGLSMSPEKSAGLPKSITAFFSKRCLPPNGKSINPNETSPQQAVKPGSAVEGQQSCTYGD